MPEDTGGVSGVHEKRRPRAAKRMRVERLVKEVELAAGLLFVRVGGSKMSVDADQLTAENFTGLPRLAHGRDSPAVHAGVDLQMGFEPGPPRDMLRALDRVGRDLEAVLLGKGERSRKKVGKDEHGRPDTGLP
jgi:hypothetical protein